MSIFLGIVCLAISFLLFLVLFVISKESEEVAPSAILGAMIMLFLIVGIGLIGAYCSPSITPMDVYRGNTTLEITYRDSVAIDSVVVWKDK